MARERQRTLRQTTAKDGQVAITHRSLVQYLYSTFSVTYPVLVTVVRLAELCQSCQRTVRDHLTCRA
ncbi:DUF7260 family protein [Salinirarus marinus]|uniref:DUF7260 family protein n=1 Tax=Salinirarus marinus TaxID=3068310 RepID=UPI003C6C77C3